MAAAIPQMPMPGQQHIEFQASAMSGAHGSPPSARMQQQQQAMQMPPPRATSSSQSACTHSSGSCDICDIIARGLDSRLAQQQMQFQVSAMSGLMERHPLPWQQPYHKCQCQHNSNGVPGISYAGGSWSSTLCHDAATATGIPDATSWSTRFSSNYAKSLFVLYSLVVLRTRGTHAGNRRRSSCLHERLEITRMREHEILK